MITLEYSTTSCLEFHQWMDVQDPVLRHRSVLKAAPEHIGFDPDAGKWMLEHPSILKWKENGEAPIWLYGKCKFLRHFRRPH